MGLLESIGTELNSIGNTVKNNGVGNTALLAGIIKGAGDVQQGYATPGGHLGPAENDAPTANPNQYASVAGPSNPNSSASTPTKNDKVVGNNGNVTSKSSSKSTSSKLAQKAAEAKAKNAQKAQENAIGQSWDSTSGQIDQVKNDVNTLNNQQSNLGAAHDAMVAAFDNKLGAQKTAITGNRDLTAKNQTKDLSTLAEDVRKSIFNSNISLGAAANSSAAAASAKALADAAGKNRASILTGYGDQISQANMDEQNANDTHVANLKASDDWEARNRQDLIDKYNNEKAVLDRLSSQVPDWKKNDIAALSESNLGKLISGLTSVSTEAKNYRDGIIATINTYKDAANAVGQEAINIDPPAALDTPVFSDQLNIPTDGQTNPDATSFTNPKITGKKQIGTDIFGNPLYDDGTTGTASAQ